jgi:tetratricopeptide (TPR) repeat protein
MGVLLLGVLHHMFDGNESHRLYRDVRSINRAVAKSMSEAFLTENEAAAELLREQLKALLTRHSFEDIVLIRALLEYYNEVATLAKRGHLSRARRDYDALQTRVPLPPSDEIETLVASFALPVSALIYWQLGEYGRAREDLLGSFAACAALVQTYGHVFHGGRQIHQAVNYARVLLAEGKVTEAASLATRLRKVNDGDRTSWPFCGADTLRLPVMGDWRRAIDDQLDKLESSLAEQSR